VAAGGIAVSGAVQGRLLFFMPASLVYVLCTTGIGLLVSVLVRTQVAAMIVTMVVTMIPAVLYSGLIIPIVSLGLARMWWPN
jgi:ABC-2 type transport system permease protein/ribosome-dependent ATPase